MAAQWAVLAIGCWLATSAAEDPTVLHPYPCELPELGENDRNGWSGGGRRNGDVLAMGEQVRVQYNASDMRSWKSIHIATCNVVNCTLLNIIGVLNGNMNYLACSGTSGNIFSCQKEIEKHSPPRFTSGVYFRGGESHVFVTELRPGSVAVWLEDYPEGAVVIDLKEGEDQLRIGTTGGPWAFQGPPLQTESTPSELSLLSPALPASPGDKLCVEVEWKGFEPKFSALIDSEENPVIYWKATSEQLHPLSRTEYRASTIGNYYARGWKETQKVRVLVPHPEKDVRWRLQVTFPLGTNVHGIQPCGCRKGFFYITTTTPQYPTTEGSHPTTEGWFPTRAGWHPITKGSRRPTSEGLHSTTAPRYPTTEGWFPTQAGWHSTMTTSHHDTTEAASPTRGDWYSTTRSYPTTRSYHTTNGRWYPTTRGSYPTTTGSYSILKGGYPTTARSYPVTTTTTTANTSMEEA